MESVQADHQIRIMIKSSRVYPILSGSICLSLHAFYPYYLVFSIFTWILILSSNMIVAFHLYPFEDFQWARYLVDMWAKSMGISAKPLDPSIMVFLLTWYWIPLVYIFKTRLVCTHGFIYLLSIHNICIQNEQILNTRKIRCTDN